MKKIITSLFLLFGLLESRAQLTFNQSDYAAWTPGVDTIRLVADTSAVASLATGINMSWDISSSTYKPTVYHRVYAADTLANYPSASYYYNVNGSLGGSINYTGKVWSGITASGIKDFGLSSTRQAFSLAAQTFGPLDSLVFPEQVSPYSTTGNVINFPGTYGTMGSSDYDDTVNFNLTIAALSYNNEPGFRTVNTIINDTIKGWGKIRVYNPNTAGPSDWINVLQVNSFTQTIDYFYLNGALISNTDLGLFGLSQGMEGYSSQSFFYRAGEVTPLVEVNWAPPDYTIPSSVFVHTEKLHDPAGVHDLSMNEDFELYPNPSADGKLFIESKSAITGDWSYAVNAMNGQNIASGKLEFNNSKAAIQTNATPGIYTVSIKKNGVVVAMKSWIAR